MAVNPYTLNGLYQKGIIDYVDPELCVGMAASPMQGMVNPYANIKAETYLNNAMQGQMYHNHGNAYDSFIPSLAQPAAIGSKSAVGSSMFGAQGIGSNSSLGVASSFGDPTIGNRYQGGFEQSMGGLSDVKNGVIGTVSKAQGIYNSTPNWVKGLLAIGIGFFAIKKGFSGMFKKAPKVQAENSGSFFSKLNPRNWFKNK